MAISKRHFALIKGIPGLTVPVTLQVLDKQGRFQDALLDANGCVTATWLPSQPTFSSPSALRDSLIQPNSSTYTHFYFQRKSLRDWGVI